MTLGDILYGFCFFYPLFMSYVWMVGALFYYLHYEIKDPDPSVPPALPRYPKISFVVPCYNEGDNAREVIGHLMKSNYPDFDVIAINDGSKDNTGAILDELCIKYPLLRIVHQAQNQGKAAGLNAAAIVSDSEFMICIDGDAILHPNAARWMLRHFLNSPRVGAVTGNPRIRTRSTILGKIQVGEFSAIIGQIKRAQRTYGKVFTVSGVVAGFRKAALHEIGYWSTDMLTEDIDVSWKMQCNKWDVRFEPAATCWILMPETLRGLWKQRVRWSMGGTQAILKYAKVWATWTSRRMWPLYVEYFLSLIWAYLMVFMVFCFAIGQVVPLPAGLQVQSLLPNWCGVLLGTTSLLQIALGSFFDRKYDKDLHLNYFYTIWYPLAYWILGWLTSVWAVPKTLLRKSGQKATWVSPDRGVK